MSILASSFTLSLFHFLVSTCEVGVQKTINREMYGMRRMVVDGEGEGVVIESGYYYYYYFLSGTVFEGRRFLSGFPLLASLLPLPLP